MISALRQWRCVPGSLMSVEILSCGHPPTPQEPGSCGTGYACTCDDLRICYTCADEAERERTRHTNIMLGYLSSDCPQITTWSGGVLATVTSKRTARVGFGRTLRTYWTARDLDGRYWYGANQGGGMCTTMRLARSATRQSSATPHVPQHPATPPR